MSKKHRKVTYKEDRVPELSDAISNKTLIALRLPWSPFVRAGVAFVYARGHLVTVRWRLNLQAVAGPDFAWSWTCVVVRGRLESKKWCDEGSGEGEGVKSC